MLHLQRSGVIKELSRAVHKKMKGAIEHGIFSGNIIGA